MAGFELIDGEEERQFYKDVRDILENARSNAYMVANDIMAMWEFKIIKSMWWGFVLGW